MIAQTTCRVVSVGFLPLLLCFSAVLAGEETAAPSWKATGWGGGGFYWACAFHPAKDGVIYLGGDCNGAYKSEDHGKHWRIINRGLSDYAVYSLAVDASHPDTVYAGVTSGICKSTDAGEHWEFLETTGLKAQAIYADRGQSVHALAIDPASGEILAGTPRGLIFKSTDGGKEWKKLYELKQKGDITSVAYSTKNGKLMLAASSNAGLLKSADGGETWTELSTPKAVKHAAFASSDDSIIYAACGKDGVYKSTDQGQTWAAQSGIDAKSVVTDLVIDPKNPDNVCAMAVTGWSGTVYRTTDGGKTWSNVGGLKTDPQTDPTLPQEGSNGHVGLSTLTNIAMNPNNSAELFISANWRNAYSADGGQNWEERNCGCDISCVTDIRFLDGKTYVTVMDEGLFESDDNGAAWKQLFPLKYTAGISGHHWRVNASKAADGAVRIISTCSPWDAPVNKVLISSDSGKTFKPFSDGFPKDRPKKNTMWGDGYVRALAVDPKDPQVVYVGIDGDPDPPKNPGGGIFKSVDGGQTWKQLEHQPGSRRMFYGLVIDPTDSKRIFWGSCGANGGLYRSEDGGETWTQVFKDEAWIFNVAVSENGKVYCGGGNLWESTDHGTTWKKISDFKDGCTVLGIEFNPKDEKALWISRVNWGSTAQGGVYKTVDGGATWQDITGDIPHRKPLVLRFNPEKSELWAGNVGLYKIEQH